mgnify:CR=1 FL=1
MNKYKLGNVTVEGTALGTACSANNTLIIHGAGSVSAAAPDAQLVALGIGLCSSGQARRQTKVVTATNWRPNGVV